MSASPNDAAGGGGAGGASRLAIVREALRLQDRLARESARWLKVDAETEEFERRERSIEYHLELNNGSSPEFLSEVGVAVVEGLIALRNAAQRPHGDLRARHVHFDSRRKANGHAVAISEMRPGGGMAPGLISDQRALGWILYRMARKTLDQRPVSALPDSSPFWPDEKEAINQHWLELIGRLLGGEYDGAPLEKLAEDLRMPARAGGGWPKWAVVGVGAVIVLAVVGGVAFFKNGKSREEVVVLPPEKLKPMGSGSDGGTTNPIPPPIILPTSPPPAVVAGPGPTSAPIVPPIVIRPIPTNSPPPAVLLSGVFIRQLKAEIQNWPSTHALAVQIAGLPEGNLTDSDRFQTLSNAVVQWWNEAVAAEVSSNFPAAWRLSYARAALPSKWEEDSFAGALAREKVARENFKLAALELNKGLQSALAESATNKALGSWRRPPLGSHGTAEYLTNLAGARFFELLAMKSEFASPGERSNAFRSLSKEFLSTLANCGVSETEATKFSYLPAEAWKDMPKNLEEVPNWRSNRLALAKNYEPFALPDTITGGLPDASSLLFMSGMREIVDETRKLVSEFGLAQEKARKGGTARGGIKEEVDKLSARKSSVTAKFNDLLASGGKEISRRYSTARVVGDLGALPEQARALNRQKAGVVDAAEIKRIEAVRSKWPTAASLVEGKKFAEALALEKELQAEGELPIGLRELFAEAVGKIPKIPEALVEFSKELRLSAALTGPGDLKPAVIQVMDGAKAKATSTGRNISATLDKYEKIPEFASSAWAQAFKETRNELIRYR